jgi:hypothetical protein
MEFSLLCSRVCVRGIRGIRGIIIQGQAHLSWTRDTRTGASLIGIWAELPAIVAGIQVNPPCP